MKPFRRCTKWPVAHRELISSFTVVFFIRVEVEMGCASSNIDSEVPKSWMDLFAAMRLTRNEVIQLHNLFKKVDFDKSGTVDIVELLTLLSVERTRFTEQLFKVFDSDGSGKIDFREFVLSVWNYCTISPSSLGKCYTPRNTAVSFTVNLLSFYRYVYL